MAEIVIAAALLMAGCAKTTTSTGTPAAPNPPQVTVLQYTQLGAASVNTAAHTLLTLCTTQPGATKATLDPTTCNQVKAYLLTAEGVFSSIATEAGTADPWATMRVKIAEIGATAVLTATITDPTLKSQIATLQSEINSILGVQ